VECVQGRHFCRGGPAAPKNWAGMNTALTPFAKRQHYGAHQWLAKRVLPISPAVLIFMEKMHASSSLNVFRAHLHRTIACQLRVHLMRKGHVPSSEQLGVTRRIHLPLLSQSFPSYSCVSDGLQPRAAERSKYMAELEIRCRGVGRGKGSRDSRSSLDGPWKNKQQSWGFEGYYYSTDGAP